MGIRLTIILPDEKVTYINKPDIYMNKRFFLLKIKVASQRVPTYLPTPDDLAGKS